MFNIFEALFSGFYFYREEFSSSLLGYVLSPFSSHGMKTKPLELFIRKLLKTEIEAEYRKILTDMLDALKDELSHPDQFVLNPLTDQYRFASSLEFKEIDVLIRIDHNILLFENKIYAGSIGKIGKQILQYKESLGHDYNVVPIAIFPDGESGYSLDHMISVFWRGNHGVSLLDFLHEIYSGFLPEHSSMKDFIDFAEHGYETSSRPRNVENKTYDEILDRFDPDYREIISRVFPVNHTVLGEDIENGGCLNYCLPLTDGQICYPFRLIVNGKCEILYQGLRNPAFLEGKSFDGTHTVRDLIRLFLQKKGIHFTTRYHFSYKEFRTAANQKAFEECLDFLAKAAKEQWDKARFYKEFLSLNHEEIDYRHFQEMLVDMQHISEDFFKMKKDDFTEIYRLLLTLKEKVLQKV